MFKLTRNTEARASTEVEKRGKTSKYRGVAKTSKSAWGVKYSAKRITSKCNTELEAARVYDAYLKANVPDKYEKYANFCPACDRFRNSLGIQTLASACVCHQNTRKMVQTGYSYASDIRDSEILNSSYRWKGESSFQPGDGETDSAKYNVPFDRFPDHRGISSTGVNVAQVVNTQEMHQMMNMNQVDGMSHAETGNNAGMGRDRTSFELFQMTLSPVNDDSLNMENFKRRDMPFDAGNDVLNAKGDEMNLELTESYEKIYRDVRAVAHGAMETVGITIKTTFFEKYWRNDRKNIQCFPSCPQFGNYYLARVNNQSHYTKTMCRTAVDIEFTNAAGLDRSKLVFFAHVDKVNNLKTFDAALISQQELHSMSQHRTLGVIQQSMSTTTQHNRTISIQFLPKVWNLPGELSRKRRKVHSRSSSTEFCFALGISIYYQVDENQFQQIGLHKSTNFSVYSTRTLTRQKSKQLASSKPASPLESPDLPTKKKIKIHMNQTVNDMDSMHVQNGDKAVVLSKDNTAYCAHRTRKEATSMAPAFEFTMVSYSICNLLASIFIAPVHILCVVVALLLPFVFEPFITAVDFLADHDLSFANKFSSAENYVSLVRMHHDQDARVASFRSTLLSKAVWHRIVYYSIGKVVVGIYSCLTLLICGLLATFFFAIRPAQSFFLKLCAKSCNVSVNYAKHVLGKEQNLDVNIV